MYLTARMREHYVLQHAAHCNDPETGRCRECDVARCQAWLDARVMLISAGIAVR